MSYILDALRKSDQQRKQGGVPTLPVAAITALSPERPAYLAFGPPMLVLILAIGIVVAWVRSWPVESTMSTTGVEKSLAVPVRQPVPAALPPLLEVPPAAPVAATPRQKSLSSTSRHTRNMSPPAVAAKVRDSAPATAEIQADRGAPMASADMPLSIRQQLPPLAVAVHLYSATPRDRLVSINGRTLREGDSLTPDMKLEQITPEGMVLTFRGYRFQRNAQ